MSPEDRSLVARSLSLFERIELLREHPEYFGDPDARAHELLGKWEQMLATPEDPGAFERRLAFDDLDRATALRVLAPLSLPETFPVPSWFAIVQAVLVEAAAPPEGPSDPHPAAFGEYWMPWLRVALRRVAAFASFPEPVRAALSHHLLHDLVRSGMQCLVHEFDLFRATHRTSNDLFFERVAAEPSTELYRAFIGGLYGDGARQFLELYPGLARLVATRIEQWSRNLTELTTRLERDTPELEAALGAPLGTLSALDVGLSDSHNGGRYVVGVRFSSGARVLYKPKDMATEHAFQTLLAKVNELGFEPRLRTLAVVAKDSYGWVEYVTPAPCSDEAELRDYYARCGALLALVTFLRGTDCHFENVIASGSQPVIIDHEALLTPSSSRTPDAGAAPGAVLQHRLHSSVLRTGLLPEWSVEPGGNVVDLSGIGARREARAAKTLRIANVNSDGMAIETFESVSSRPFTNEPTAGGGLALPASETEARVKDGFTRVYRLLASHARERDELVSLFAGLPTRFVARTTAGYGLLLRESRKPQLLKDGLIQTLALDRIARMLLIGLEERPPAWPLIRAEHAAMARGDVPFFALRSDDVALFECEPERGEMRLLANGVFDESGLDAVREGARAMNEEELALEVKLIECSFEGKAAGIGTSSSDDEARARILSTSEPSRSEDEAPFDDDRAAKVALGLAHEIRESALVFHGEHHRVGLEFDEVARIHRVALLGAETYNGYGGIALFLGIASQIGHDERLRTAALTTLAVTRAQLRRDPTKFVAGVGVGGFQGLGSLIYSFAELGRWIDEPSLVDDARLLARSIAPSQIDDSPLQDLLSGNAGLLFALAALDRVTESKDFAPMIAHCGRRLVASAVAQTKGVGWPMRPGTPALCGMAHGNAGIAAALFEAWRLGGSRELRDTAQQALAYERALRNDDVKNWPDLRDDVPEGAFLTTWCNGAPGIALARSRILAIEDQAELREDLELAIEGTKKASLPGGHLCCGMGGIDEILFEVGLRKGDAALTEVARRRTMSRITRSEHEGRWPRVVVRGLMRGSAGIGLGLLRMSRAGKEIPCVLDLSA